MPASPTTNVTWPRSDRARSNASRSRPSSRSRPTNGVSPRSAATSSLERQSDAERRLDGPACMVLMCDGRPEERHDAVTEKLVDRAFVAVHLGQHEVEGSAHQAVDFLRVDTLGQRSEPRDVHKKHRDLLTLALQCGPRGEDLLDEVLWSVGLGGGEACLPGGLTADWNPAFVAESGPDR